MVITPFPLLMPSLSLLTFQIKIRLATFYEAAETQFGPLDEAIPRV